MTELKQQVNPIQVHYPFEIETYPCTIVVDIGLALGQGKNCGIAISEIKKSKVFVGQMSFSEMIETVYGKLVEYGSNERGLGLILEAPLSAHFRDGSPAARVFHADGDRVTERQAWYASVDASIMMGAVILLKSLFMRSIRDSRHEPMRMSVYEAFSTQKPHLIQLDEEKLLSDITRYKLNPWKNFGLAREGRLNDWIDALFILDQFTRGKSKLLRVESEGHQSITALFGLDNKDNSIPSIVRLDGGFWGNYKIAKKEE